jgi:hypothetical protein
MKKKVQMGVGVVIGLALLWWVFRDTDWAKVGQAIRGANWLWLGIAAAAMFATFFTRILRWRYIVRTAGPVSFRVMFSATQIGFFANFTLPGRVGEVIRAVVLSRLAKIPFTQCFAFVALDRVTDLVGLMAVMLVAVLSFHPASRIIMPPEAQFPEWAKPLLEPNAIRMAAASAGLMLFAVVIALVGLYLNQRLMLRITSACVGVVSRRFAERVCTLLQHFAEGLCVFRSVGDMSKSIFFSLVTWALFIVAYFPILLAFHLTPPWYAPFVILALLAVAISMPGPPGFVGQFHAAMLVGILITMPNADVDVVRALAIVAHLINLVTVAIAGVYCLYREQFGLIELSRESAQEEG